MSDTFDVDKCVNEDGRRCEFYTDPTIWQNGHFCGPVRFGEMFAVEDEDGVLLRLHELQIRNIQPRPRTVTIQAWMSSDGSLQIARLDEPTRVNVTLPAVDATPITIDLDKCEQVQPDGVMTPDELRAEGIVVVPTESNGERTWSIRRDGDGWYWRSIGQRWTSTPRVFFWARDDADTEATRIVREKLI